MFFLLFIPLAFFQPTLSQPIFSTSTVTMTPQTTTYQTKCVCITDPILIEAITTIDIRRATSISFVSIGPTVDTGNSAACVINTKLTQNQSGFEMLVVRYVVVSSGLGYVFVRVVEVGQGHSGEEFRPNVTWEQARMVVLFRGCVWQSATTATATTTLTIPTLTWNGTHLKPQNPLTQNSSFTFTLVFYNTKLSTRYTNSDSYFLRSPSMIMGYSGGRLPTTSAIVCEAEGCKVSGNGSFVYVGSEFEESLYKQAVQAIQQPSPNWLMISLVSLSSLIAFLLLIPTIRYIRDYFWPVTVVPVEEQLGQLTHDQIHINRHPHPRIHFSPRQKPKDYQPVKCCICLDNDSNCVVRPCGHNEFCENCIAYICRRKRECSICRTGIERVEWFQVELNCECVRRGQEGIGVGGG